MRTLALALLALLFAGPASAITLGQATTEAHNWVVTRQEAILNRVEACITEGNPRLCHTAWAASVTPNTTPAAPALATVTLDDPGRITVDQCANECATGEGTFAAAGIAIPATAPINAKLNIGHFPDRSWGAQLVIRIRYDGVVYERGYGRGAFEGFAWRAVPEVP